MSGGIAVIIGFVIIIGAVYLLVKQYDTRMVLIGAGLLMAIFALKPLEAFQAFADNMILTGFIQTVCSVMGFAFVMKLTECDKHLIHGLAKGLMKVQWLLIPGAALITFLINISLISAAGAAAAVGSILIPLLISMGVAPAMAASAVMLGTFGSMLSPALPHQPMIAELANMEIMDVIKVHAFADVVAVIIGAVSLTIIARLFKEDKGYVNNDDVDIELGFKVNPFFAILPLVPIILLLVFNNDYIRSTISWATDITVPIVMLFGAMLCMVATRTNPAEASNSYFEGLGRGFADIMGIVMAAGVFVAGMSALGLIEASIDILKTSTGIIPLATTYGPFILAIICGSGDAAAIAFNESVTIHAADFGFETVKMGSLAALAGSLGRTMSPIAAAAIICATLAKVNPLEIAKRNAIGMIIASVVVMFMLMYS